MARKVKWLAATAGAGAILVMSSAAGPVIEPHDYGFVLTRLSTAIYRGDEKIDCPEGRSPSLKDAYLATQTPAERARLLRPENSVELEQRYKVDYVVGPAGRDICTAPAEFDTPAHPPQKIDRSPVSLGLDLDGARDDAHPTPGTCAHQSFRSPTGETGIDNQFFRAVACNTFWRGAPGGVSDGENLKDSPLTVPPAVIVVRGVDSWENDPHVEVVVAGTPDPQPTDVRQKIISGGSMTMTDNPRYRTVLQGHIDHGVLTTEPADIILAHNWVGASGGELVFRHARLRVRLQPDGTLAGVAGAYRPIDNAIGVLEVGGPGVASTAGVDCASVRKTLRMLADGDPDPSTGACTSISMGLEFAAKPAFVFDHGALAGAAMLRGPR